MGEALFRVEGWAVGVPGEGDGPPRTLLEGLELALHPGEIVAAVGPSGAGKTTLLRSLATLIDPLAGEVLLAGATPAALGFPAYRRRVSYLAQRPVVVEATIRDNLAWPYAFACCEGELDAERGEALLAELGMPDALARSARPLSEGEQQRVCLARTLLIEPDVLLLDEPTSALDADAVERAEAALHSALQAGACALVVTHDADQIARLAARVLDLSPLSGSPAP